MSYEMLHGDCLTELPKLIERGVRLSLVNADIPYFKVKANDWDRQWKDEAAFLAWVGEICGLLAQVTAPNGSLYLYASPLMARKVEGIAALHFNVLNSIRWIKDAGWHKKADKESVRSYLSPWEAVIFAEHYGADNRAKGEAGYVAKCDELRGFVFEPLRAYLDGERERAGFSRKDCERACGNQMSGHYFSRVQWELPTRTNYEKLRAAFNGRGGDYLRKDYDYLRKDYDELRKDYDELRKDYELLRRPFNVSSDVPYTDVWDFPTVLDYPGKHPCEKPYAMMEHIVRASSREGDLALDLCAGSGVFGEAALANGRDVIAIESDAHWARKAANRAGRVRGQRVNLPTPPRNPIDTPLFNTEVA